MKWALAALLCVILVEFAILLPFGSAISNLINLGRRASHVVSSKRISAHWKESVMGIYARRTLLATLRLALLTTIFFGLAIFLVLIYEAAGAKDFNRFIFSWSGMGFTFAFAGLYAWARTRLCNG